MPASRWLRLAALTGLLLISLETGAWAQLGLTLIASQQIYAPGETLVLSLAAQNSGLPAVADFYLGCLRPDGDTVLLFVGPALSPAIGRVSQPSTLRPVASGIPLAGPFTVHAPGFLRHQLADSDPTGPYVCFMIAAPPGGLGTQPLLAVATAEFTVSHSLGVQVRLDTTKSVTATLPTSGGTLTTTAADGTRFTLTVPPDALLVSKKITMIPIAAVDGLPGGRFAAGVQLQPEGLRLYEPATLTIAPPTAVSLPSPTAFASHDDGREAHRYPLVGDSGIVVNLLHFSDYAIGDGISIPAPPMDPEDRLMHEIAELVRTDPSRLGDVLRGYFDTALAPELAAAETNCSEATRIIPRAVGWVKLTQILGFGPQVFQNEINRILASWRTSVANCFLQASRPCVDPTNQAQVEQVLGLARQGQLIDVPLDPETVTVCEPADGNRYVQVRAWVVVVTAVANQVVEVCTSTECRKMTIRHTVNGTFTLDSKGPNSDGSTFWQGGGTISGTVDDETVTTSSFGGCPSIETEKGSGSLPRDFGNTVLTIDPVRRTWQLRIQEEGFTVDRVFRYSCNIERTDRVGHTLNPREFSAWVDAALPSRLIIGMSGSGRYATTFHTVPVDWDITWDIRPAGASQ